MPELTDVILLLQALLDHNVELRNEIIELRKSAGYIDTYSDLVYDISDFPAYQELKEYLTLQY